MTTFNENRIFDSFILESMLKIRYQMNPNQTLIVRTIFNYIENNNKKEERLKTRTKDMKRFNCRVLSHGKLQHTHKRLACRTSAFTATETIATEIRDIEREYITIFYARL